MRPILIIAMLAIGSVATARPQAPIPTPVPPKQTAGRVMGDIVTQPLQDTNIKTKHIPEVLELARGDPYSVAGLRTCAAINSNIAQLTSVLGADFDSVEDRRVNRGEQAASVGRSVVQSLIPFRGVVREVTGAASAQREWDAAVDAGIARRGFLRGTAKARGCRVAS